MEVLVDAFPIPPLDGVLSSATERALEIHTQLRNSINDLPTIAQCSAFYDNAQYQECLRLLRSSQNRFLDAHPHQHPLQARDIFARNWAIARSREEDWAVALDHCRQTALHLLYRVCNLSPPGDTDALEAVRIRAISDEFQIRRISQIVMNTLAMDRANCLYNMSIMETREIGLGWYSQDQEDEYQHLGDPPLPLNHTGPMINKRLRRLQRSFFQDHEFVTHWLTPAAPDRFFHDDLMPRDD